MPKRLDLAENTLGKKHSSLFWRRNIDEYWQIDSICRRGYSFASTKTEKIQIYF
jgi:hypothetical protein